ncbi:MAG: hypothetical protein WBP41_07810, partial [Saprospiraceae bacterium]
MKKIKEIADYFILKSAFKYLGIIAVFIFLPQRIFSQIQAHEIGFPPDSSHLYILGTDTVHSSLTFGQGMWYNAYLLINALDSLAGDHDWYEAGNTAPNSINDEMYHMGDVHIGDATMSGTGALNVTGRIDQQFPAPTGDGSMAIGRNTLSSLTSGGENMAIGTDALWFNDSGHFNTAIGLSALLFNTSGSRNIALGTALLLNDSGNDNVGIGRQALFANSSGSENVAVGNGAGEGSTGSGNVLIGFNAGAYEGGSDKLYIENSNSSTPLIWGDFANDTIKINGRLGYTSNAGTPTKISGRYGSYFSDISLGYGLDLSSGVLRADTNEIATPFDISIIHDDDWYEVGTTTAPDAITDDMFHTGKVGIGTTSPLDALHVVGRGRIGVGSNTMIGESSGNLTLSGIQNVLIGVTSGENLTTGSYNTVIGPGSGASLNTGESNVFNGNGAGNSTTSGSLNVYLGYGAGLNNNIGSYNIGIGNGALNEADSSDFNIGIGWLALRKINSYCNIGIGKGTLSSAINAMGNVAIGFQSAALAHPNVNNIFLGTNSGYSSEGSQNVMIGESAGANNLANQSIFIGTASGGGSAGISGTQNIGLGNSSLSSVTSGSLNVAIGTESNYSNLTGNNNSTFGFHSGYSNTGSSNLYLGAYSGENATGSSNIFLGYQAGLNESGSNKLYVETSSSSSPLIYGEFNNDLIKINGKIGYTTNGSTATSLTGRDGTYLSDVSLGSGISIPGGVLTFTEVDGSITNELQTLANTSDATSHTTTLSNSGGSVKLVEGTGITLTTSGTSLDGIATIATTALLSEV